MSESQETPQEGGPPDERHVALGAVLRAGLRRKIAGYAVALAASVALTVSFLPVRTTSHLSKTAPAAANRHA